jgi:hypothetical protein
MRIYIIQMWLYLSTKSKFQGFELISKSSEEEKLNFQRNEKKTWAKNWTDDLTARCK